MGLLDMLFGTRQNAIPLKELIASGALIVDVRTPHEFHNGHAPNAINIPLQSISQKIVELKKMNKPIITVCQSGARSAMAKAQLKQAGIEAYNGGGWSSFHQKIL